jgi:uncharacterized protein (TIGR02646 family)
MRYIDKTQPCGEFDTYVSTKNPKSWDDSSTGKRKKLAQHLFEQEQGELCAYCEDDLPKPLGGSKNEVDISHIDHIYPKSNPQYKHLEFDQKNLVLSCLGYAHKTQPRLFELNKNGRVQRSELKEKPREFCGWYKDNHPTMRFDQNLFLFPTETKDISTYFDFNIEGRINPNPLKNKTAIEKAQYTIDLLNLNHEYLVKQRKEEYEHFLEDGSSLPDSFPLNRFHSMLAYFFT